MRLHKKEQQLIIETLKNSISDAVIYLFGSRADENRRGGDIDLFLLTNNDVSLKDKIDLLVQLECNGIERKVDLIIQSPNQKRERLYKEVLQKGIRLC
jgi:predicted nucleotidyltransferase